MMCIVSDTKFGLMQACLRCCCLEFSKFLLCNQFKLVSLKADHDSGNKICIEWLDSMKFSSTRVLEVLELTSEILSRALVINREQFVNFHRRFFSTFLHNSWATFSYRAEKFQLEARLINYFLKHFLKLSDLLGRKEIDPKRLQKY